MIFIVSELCAAVRSRQTDEQTLVQTRRNEHVGENVQQVTQTFHRKTTIAYQLKHLPLCAAA